MLEWSIVDTLAPVASPVAKAVALVESGIFDSYLVVQQDRALTVAGGTRAVITLDGDQVQLRYHGGQSRRSWLGRPLVKLGEMLAGLPISGWSACGWVAFELAHLLAGRRDLAGNGVLAQLIVPRAVVRISSDDTVIDCDNSVLRDRIELVLGAVLAMPEPRPPETEVVWWGADWYSRAVDDAVWRIRRGTLRTVTLSAMAPVTGKIDLPRTYLASRPDSSFLLNMGGVRALGSCPQVETHDSWADFEASFPAVCASGLPKAAACEYIARSERGSRGLYGGAVVTAGPDGSIQARTVLGVLAKGEGVRAGTEIVPASTSQDRCAQVRARMREIAPCQVSTDS
jgi:hypothetical protein